VIASVTAVRTHAPVSHRLSGHALTKQNTLAQDDDEHGRDRSQNSVLVG